MGLNCLSLFVFERQLIFIYFSFSQLPIMRWFSTVFHSVFPYFLFLNCLSLFVFERQLLFITWKLLNEGQ